MISSKKMQKKIIDNLEKIFIKAMINENLNTAIQAQKTIAKVYNTFLKDTQKKEISLNDLTENDIKKLISQSQKKINNNSSKD